MRSRRCSIISLWWTFLWTPHGRRVGSWRPPACAPPRRRGSLGTSGSSDSITNTAGREHASARRRQDAFDLDDRTPANAAAAPTPRSSHRITGRHEYVKKADSASTHAAHLTAIPDLAARFFVNNSGRDRKKRVSDSPLDSALEKWSASAPPLSKAPPASPAAEEPGAPGWSLRAWSEELTPEANSRLAPTVLVPTLVYPNQTTLLEVICRALEVLLLVLR